MLKKIFAVAVCVLFATIILANQMSYKVYAVADGLPQSQVYAMLQDSRGYLWVGTQGGGLSRFDGAKFLHFNTKAGLSDNFVTALEEDSEHNIWVGTEKGLSIFDGKIFTPVDFGQTLHIESLAKTPDGKIYIGTTAGLYTFSEGKATKFGATETWNQEDISDILVASDGKIWLATNHGVVRLEGNKAQLYTKENGLSVNLVNAIGESTNGEIWVGLYGGGVAKFDGAGFKRMRGLNDSTVLTIHAEADGNMWLGTLNSGVAIYTVETKSFTYLDEAAGMPENTVTCILEDDWKNHWIGTSGGGMVKYTGTPFVHIGPRQGLPDEQVYAINQDKDGTYWIGAGDYGLFRMKAENGFNFEYDRLMRDVKVRTIFRDSKDRMWVGSDGGGMRVYDTAKDTTMWYWVRKGLGSNWVKDIIEGPDGTMYIATYGSGITVMKPTDKASEKWDFSYYGWAQDMPGDRINCLHLDDSGQLWFGTLGAGLGVIRKDGSVQKFSDAEGLEAKTIKCFLQVEDKLWFGTSRFGISSIALDGTNTIEKVDASLTSSNVYLLLQDAQGDIWAGSEQGVDRIKRDETGLITSVEHYGASEGFVGVETTSKAAFQDKIGDLWFCTIGGIEKTSPRATVQKTSAPSIALTDVGLFYKSIGETDYKDVLGSWGEINGDLALKHDENHLSFDFSGLHFQHPNKVRYQWRLLGMEEEWSPPSTRDNTTYSNLPSGDFTFEVRACLEDGTCSESKSMAFAIATPFWKEWWFYAACIAAGVLLIVLFLWAYIATIKHREKAKNKQLEMERNLLEFESKALRLQMNPHFIFNSLNSIQGLVAQQDGKTARMLLGKFAKLMRQTLENSREQYILVTEELEALENYLSVQQATHENKFDYKIECKLDADKFQIPPLIVQPFVENAIIHGVLPKEEKGLINITVSDYGMFVKIEIEDNGIGRKAAGERKTGEAEHKSHGIEVTLERLAAIKKKGPRAKPMEVIDLRKDGEILGTKVILNIPKIEVERKSNYAPEIVDAI